MPALSNMYDPVTPNDAPSMIYPSFSLQIQKKTDFGQCTVQRFWEMHILLYESSDPMIAGFNPQFQSCLLADGRGGILIKIAKSKKREKNGGDGFVKNRETPEVIGLKYSELIFIIVY